MVANWVPWSAASLVSGAVLLVLGVLTLPLGDDVTELMAALPANGPRWLMGASALILASLGLTLGMPVIAWLLGAKSRAALAGLWVWSMGTIGLAALGTMVLVLETVDSVVALDAQQAATLLSDPSLAYFAYVVVGCFLLGELVVALSLARARVVDGWVPGLLVAHVLSTPLVMTWPMALSGVHAVALGVAVMGIASRATEAWSGQPA